MDEPDVVVIGGGASGLMAAGCCAGKGVRVLVLEKKGKAAAKVRISGKGRCNVTNDAPIEELLENIPGNGRFLTGAFHRFGSQSTKHFFSELGVALKTERGGRVFPESDSAHEVGDALERYAREQGAVIRPNKPVSSVWAEGGEVRGVRCHRGELIPAQAVLLCTGGGSYPETGSTGDGWGIAQRLGHSVSKPLPSLVPLRTREIWPAGVQGLTLKNVVVSIHTGHCVQKAFGELLLTPFGVGGPTILTLSRTAAQWLAAGRTVMLQIDLKPALDDKQLDTRLQRDFEKYSRKQLKNGMVDLLPQAMIPVVLAAAGVPGERPVHQITRQERRRLLHAFKGMRIGVVSTLPLSAAIVTQGGVSVDEVNPRTMESRLVSGLFFGGEVLDVDGYTGGFNLQIAFSTGFAAGTAAAQIVS